MENTVYSTITCDISDVTAAISAGSPYEYVLSGPSVNSRNHIKNIIQEYLKAIGKEKSYNLLCLCMEEIISNSVKANIKRAYFLSNNLDINNQDDYERGMKHFKEAGVANTKDKEFVKQVHDLGLYVKLCFFLKDDIFYITARNNSVISSQELDRINKKLKLSENQSPEDIFMNSIDTTEGAGLGIIMITKILRQLSTAKDCFSIRATDTETITELKITKA